MGSIKDDIPFLTDEQIQSQAEHFLHSKGLQEILPVDVDTICDDLGIGVVAEPLEKNFGIHAYITSDFKSIWVDADVYENNIQRARFSIAHELGHYLLHRAFYEQQGVDSIEAYVNFQNSISDSLYAKIEYQADMFAGALLVPSMHLASEMERHFDMPADVLVSGDLSKIGSLITTATEKFHVSDRCLLRCIKRDFPSLHANLLASVA